MKSLLSNSIRNLSQVMEGEKVIELALDLIDPDPSQPRKTFSESGLNEIAASIRATRVHEPIVVTQRGARYLIVFGERRWRGSRIADKKTVPSIVRDMTDVDIKVARLVENMQKESVDPIEEAAAIKELIEILGGGRGVQKKAAEMLGCSEAQISQRLAMLDMPEEIKGAVIDGHIKDATTALDVARIHAVDPVSASALVEKAKAGDLKRDEVRDAAKTAKAKKPKAPADAAPVRCEKTVDMWNAEAGANDNVEGVHGSLSVCQNLLSSQQRAVLSGLFDELADNENALDCLAEVVRAALSFGSTLGHDTNKILAAVNDNSKEAEESGHGR